MSRNLPTGFGTLLDSSKFHPVFLVELDWPTGIAYAWNGYRDLVWDGKTFVGTGHLGSISPLRESRDLSANGVILTLSGIPSENVALALANDSQGRSGKVWFGELDISSGSFTVDPYLIFDGVIDVCPIEEDSNSATIRVHLEKELIDRRTRGRRYTHEDQQISYAGDLGFEYVAGLADKPLNWNGPATAGAGATEISDEGTES